MSIHTFSYDTFHILREGLIEMLVHHDAKLAEEEALHFCSFLQQHLKAPYGLKVHKVNPYAYTFGALHISKLTCS